MRYWCLLVAVCLLCVPSLALTKSAGDCLSTEGSDFAAGMGFVVEDFEDVCAVYSGTVNSDDFFIAYHNSVTYPGDSTVWGYTNHYHRSVNTSGSTIYLHEDTYDNYHWIAQLTSCEGGVGGHTYHVMTVHPYYNDSALLEQPPVANFACDNVYSNPEATITCTDLSTNEPTAWEFGVWDHNDNSTYLYYSTSDSPWEFNLSDVGDYDVGLTVSNEAGEDTEIKEEYIHIQLFTNWTPTPTTTIVAPTWVPIETINMSYMNESFFYNTTFGGLFQPWITFWDYLGGFFSEILTSVQEILNWPFDQINDQMEGITGISDDTIMSLSSYIVVPLLILGKYINIIPWQIQSLISILLVVEVMFIIIGMRR